MIKTLGRSFFEVSHGGLKFSKVERNREMKESKSNAFSGETSDSLQDRLQRLHLDEERFVTCCIHTERITATFGQTDM